MSVSSEEQGDLDWRCISEVRWSVKVDIRQSKTTVFVNNASMNSKLVKLLE